MEVKEGERADGLEGEGVGHTLGPHSYPLPAYIHHPCSPYQYATVVRAKSEVVPVLKHQAVQSEPLVATERHGDTGVGAAGLHGAPSIRPHGLSHEPI